MPEKDSLFRCGQCSVIQFGEDGQRPVECPVCDGGGLYHVSVGQLD